MNKGLKIIGVTMSLLLPSVFLAIVLINAPYITPEQLERFRLFTLTNYYMQQCIFRTTIVFTVLAIIILLVVLFYPESREAFVMKWEDDKLTIDKKAIEGLIHSHLHEEEFIYSPKVRIRSTKNRIYIHVNGDLKRTSSLVRKTGVLMQDIEEGITKVLGTEKAVRVTVTHSGYEEQEDTRDYKHSRVEQEGQIVREPFSAHEFPIIFGGSGPLLTVLWLTIGFFKTLLTVIIAATGVGIGFYLEQSGIADQFLKS